MKNLEFSDADTEVDSDLDFSGAGALPLGAKSELFISYFVHCNSLEGLQSPNFEGLYSSLAPVHFM